jgi:hypothetical protein
VDALREDWGLARDNLQEHYPEAVHVTLLAQLERSVVPAESRC